LLRYEVEAGLGWCGEVPLGDWRFFRWLASDLDRKCGVGRGRCGCISRWTLAVGIVQKLRVGRGKLKIGASKRGRHPASWRMGLIARVRGPVLGRRGWGYT